MQVSIKWLHDYIDFTETAEELADKLTMAGIPVENVIRADEGLEKVVTGKVENIVPHPDSDHMFITTMNVGGAEPVQIVTGAQNVHQDDIVPVAMVGAKLPTGQKISKGKLRGVPSNGMLCSADELKLDTTNMTEEQLNGIYILPKDTPVGVAVTEVLGLDDVVLEFELTANRGDCFSVFGLIREVAILTGNEPKWPEIKVNEDDAAKAADMIKIGIEAHDLCSRFSGRVLKNVKIGPSPKWMQQRLDGAGIRAINNVVDVTNFVMVDQLQGMLQRIVIYHTNEAAREGALRLTKLLIESTAEIKRATTLLHAITKNQDELLKITSRIDKLESEGDHVFRGELAYLFENFKDPIELIKWKDLLEGLEDTLDHCEKMADLLKGVVMKYA